jgi:hypothetical protein
MSSTTVSLKACAPDETPVENLQESRAQNAGALLALSKSIPVS